MENKQVVRPFCQGLLTYMTSPNCKPFTTCVMSKFVGCTNHTKTKVAY